MRILLDTQALIWALEDDSHLTQAAKEAILLADEVFVSAISYFEIAIKLQIPKKIGANKPLPVTLEAARLSDFNLLSFKTKHLLTYQQIPFYNDHRDPFDRMILAIALAEGLTIVSSDHNFSRYQPMVSVVW